MAASEALTDHARIRAWAEARRARPACVRGTRGKADVGLLRLDLPGYAGGAALEEISWEEWFEQFDDHHLALVVQGETADGQKRHFHTLISRAGRVGPVSSDRA